MKFTLSWLKDYLETEASLDEITTRLTAIGLEVEAVENRSEELAPFVVGYVTEAVQHPDADRLRLCTVDNGDGLHQVVCGAPNARAGMKGVFATVGTVIPGSGERLREARIRGVESRGMLCSEREMKLSDEHDGIIELPDTAPVGTPFAAVMGLDDPLIEIAVTPNRQDCLGVYGIARDLAASGLGSLKAGDVDALPGNGPCPVGVTIMDDAAAGERPACPLFVGRLIRGITNGDSPEWMRRRLQAIGLRPISALVDVTNYLTYDRGRPLHVYDAAKLNGGIEVRLGRNGESLLALDGNSYDLDSEMCVIADRGRALGLGGVMGGEASGCTKGTTDVFVESALFDTVRTAMTGRRLGIDSDARYRFERGVDPEFTIAGMEMASRLIIDICGGTASDPVIAGSVPKTRRTVHLRANRPATLGGLDVPLADSRQILEALGFTTKTTKDGLDAAVPSWRGDIDGEADLVEEVVRIRGYDRIPATPLPHTGAVATPTLTPLQRRVRLARRVLAARGHVEALTWSFTDRQTARLFAGGDPALAITNPISAELDQMRPSALPNLLMAMGRNMDRGATDFGLFEVGPDFADDTPAGETVTVSLVRTGATGPRHWQEKPRPLGALDVKADALAVLGECGAPVGNLSVSRGAPDWYHPGRSGSLGLGPKNILAHFGEIHPRVLSRMGLAGPFVATRIFLQNLPQSRRKGSQGRGPLGAPDLLPVSRDFAFVVDDTIDAAEVLKAARGADRKLITDGGIFDVYRGGGIADDKKSIAVCLTLQPRDHTLTEAELEAASNKVVEAVAKATGATLRS